MQKTTFTENQMYTIIDAWYGHDEVFRHIARGRVQSHLAEGLELDEDFIFKLLEIATRWCRKREAI